ncbi:MAG: hypothetical protein PVH19_12055 [Planctomycetia bacterium]|jgi:hypothetical protein
MFSILSRVALCPRFVAMKNSSLLLMLDEFYENGNAFPVVNPSAGIKPRG